MCIANADGEMLSAEDAYRVKIKKRTLGMACWWILYPPYNTAQSLSI
jgi:hypothetical protein